MKSQILVALAAVIVILILGCQSPAPQAEAKICAPGSCRDKSRKAVSSKILLSKTQILELFRKTAESNQIISGQNLGHADGASGDIEIREMKANTGKVTMILGMDLGFEMVGKVPDQSINYLIDFADKGGIVTLSMHPLNPKTGKDSWDTEKVDVDRLLDPGTPEGKRWNLIIENVLSVVEQFHLAKVPVLWRPLHEMNGGWFWWGGKQSDWMGKDQFTKVWVQMHRKFEERGFNNVLWVYSPNCRNNEKDNRPEMHFYPGKDVVDLVSIDCYTQQASDLNKFGGYDDLVRTEKPIWISEIGPPPGSKSELNANVVLEMKDLFPKLSGCMFWHRSRSIKHSLGQLSTARDLLKSPRVLSLRQ